MEQQLIEKVLDKIDREEIVDLVMRLVDISSLPGEEAEVAEFILNWLRDNGIEAIRQEVEPGRWNAVGILRGSGRGLSLMFNGHLDTSHPGTAEDLETIGSGLASLRPKAFLEDDVVYGLGSFNCKGPVATALITLKALKESGINLSGDVTVAAVCGEIGIAPIGKYQGPAYHGHGYGTRYLLNHGVVPDLALVVEPSSHQLVWSLPGVLHIKVTTYGESVYIPFVDRARWQKEGTNCIQNTIKMLQVIEDWAVEYEERNKYETEGGTVVAKVNIGAIEAGIPCKPNWSLASCSAFLDVRVLPTRQLMDVKRELEDVLQKAGGDYRIEVYRSQKGYEGKNNQQLVDAIRSSYKQLLNTENRKAESVHASMWNDVNIFHELDIPAVKFGIGAVSVPSLSQRGTQVGHEGVRVEEYVKMAQLYALTAVRLCTEEGR